MAATGELITEKSGVLILGVEGMMITGAICGSVCLFWETGQVFGVPVLSVVFYSAALPLFLLTLAMTLRNRG